MLAPLKDRSVIEREPSPPQTHEPSQTTVTELQADNRWLRTALRQARQSQRRSATEAARRIVALTNDINRLTNENAALRLRVEEFVSGQAIVSLGQQLMTLSEANDQLVAAAQRVWYLDKTLCAAHHECERLARERDAAVARLCPEK